MKEDETPDDSDLGGECGASRFLVMGAYGETIFRFQCLELSFWSIRAYRQKQGMTFDQRMRKVESWDRKTTLGNLAKTAEIPDELKEEAKELAEIRDYLAHRFMRERAPFLGDPAYCQRVAEELAEALSMLDDFEERLDDYIQGLGISRVSDDELDKLGVYDLYSTKWVNDSIIRSDE